MELTLDKLTKEVIGKTIFAFDTWNGENISFVICEISFKNNGCVYIKPRENEKVSAWYNYISMKQEVFLQLVENNNAVDSTTIDGCVVKKVYELK